MIMPSLMEPDISLQEEGLTLPTQPLQVTDDQGNPIHFTMQDGSALQVIQSHFLSITLDDHICLNMSVLNGFKFKFNFECGSQRPLL